ncbi:MAG: C-GCAxxG-C-C family protein [Candidatus Thermoplasmatota archaeon]|nr:C-GCAxxG-C-C family protein [Candidatus Thermoplasmatota archaeon]
MNSKEEILEKVHTLAFKYEAERGSCPQCVLSALYETLGVGDPKTIQASDAMAGGTSLSTVGTCGALVGGLLAIGAVVGRTYEDFSAGKRKRRVFQFSKKLYDKFVEEYGSPRCKDIHLKLFGRTFNLLDPVEYAEFEKAGGHVDKCTVVSAKAARWAAEILIDDLKIKF